MWKVPWCWESGFWSWHLVTLANVRNTNSIDSLFRCSHSHFWGERLAFPFSLGCSRTSFLGLVLVSTHSSLAPIYLFWPEPCESIPHIPLKPVSILQGVRKPPRWITKYLWIISQSSWVEVPAFKWRKQPYVHALKSQKTHPRIAKQIPTFSTKNTIRAPETPGATSATGRVRRSSRPAHPTCAAAAAGGVHGSHFAAGLQIHRESRPGRCESKIIPSQA